MLGTRKVKVADKNDSPEKIMENFYSIMDTNKYTTMKRVNELFARSGSDNRRVMTAKEMDEVAYDTDGIVYNTLRDTNEKTIIKICQVVSQYTDPFKRKCVMAAMMANGNILRYPDTCKLRVDTNDPVMNAENEGINNLISEFRDKLQTDYETATLNFHAFMENNLPKEVRDEFIVKAGDYFTQADNMGNIKKALTKAYRAIGQNYTDDDYKPFKDVLTAYRAATKAMSYPGWDRVSEFLAIDKKTMIQRANDGIAPILSLLPDKVIKSVMDGE